MNVKKSSWHYQFQDIMATQPYWRDDICSYWRGFIQACFKVSFLLLLLALILAYFMLVGTNIMYPNISDLSFVQGVIALLVGMASIIAAVVGIFGLPAAINYTIERIREKTSSKTKTKPGTKEPSLFAAKYKAFKTKTCHRIQFIED